MGRQTPKRPARKLAGGISFVLAASDYPTRYIDLIVPNEPGGAMDTINRCYKDKVEKILGQPIVYTHKPGASGAIGIQYAKGLKPDGYSLVAGNPANMIVSPLSRTGTTNLNDFAPVCTLSYSPLIFVVSKDSPYKTMRDFVEAAKTKKMKIASTGTMGTNHIIMVAFTKTAGFEPIYMPFGSSAAAMTAVLGGHADMTLCSPSGVEAQLRILAVGDNIRAETFPEVPTLKESGYPFSRAPSYASLWAPKDTPREIVDKIYGAYKRALEENKEEITKRVHGAGQIPFVFGPEKLMELYLDAAEFYEKEVPKKGATTK